MFDVSLVRCESYEMDEVRRALGAVLAPLDGLSWVQPGMKIAVKVNLVTFAKPDAAATTHPALLVALVEMLKERGAEVVIGDSPGGIYTGYYVDRVYSATGMHLAEKAGAALNHNFSVKEVEFPEAKIARRFTYTAYLDDVDAIIDFCKLKSHGMMSMSAAVKNLFGAIPGTMKPEYHYLYPNERDFADMLVDLNEFFKPRLCIADAVIGMEGNGPTAGNPRKIGALLASTNSYALDLACAELIGLEPDDVPTIRAAQERRLCAKHWSELQISGDIGALRISDFDNIRNRNSIAFQTASRNIVSRLAFGVFAKAMASKPKVVQADCVGCAVCQKTCPAKAIDMIEKKPKIDRKKCIRCFCCQEFCPKGALVVGRSPVARLLLKEAKHG